MVIFFGVMWVLLFVVLNFNSLKFVIVYKYVNYGIFIELIWIISFVFILIVIVFFSFKLFYFMDEVIFLLMIIKVVGY